MRTVEAINAEIAELEIQLAEVQGTETEVYTRIVGYYRSLRNWNKGKREEYRHRLTYEAVNPEAVKADEASSADEEVPAAAQTAQGMLFENREAEAAAEDQFPAQEISTYSYFFRKTCPNCPPVRNFISRLPIEGNHVDVDTEEGMNKAVSYQVLSTPTVVFFNRDGRPVQQSHSIDQLTSLFADFPVG